MDEIKSVEDLDVFQRSHKLTLELYKLTEDFPFSEKFGLVSQDRKGDRSIMHSFTTVICWYFRGKVGG